MTKEEFIKRLNELDEDNSLSTERFYKEIRQAYYDYTFTLAEYPAGLENLIYVYMIEEEAMEYIDNIVNENCDNVIQVFNLVKDAAINEWVFYVDTIGNLQSAEMWDIHELICEILEEIDSIE